MSGQDTLQQVQIETLGRYRVLRRLGRGGMGEVWLCEDQRLNRQVAVKTLPVRNQQDKAFVQRFEHEAKAAAALHHPHILAVHDYGKQELPNGSVLTYIVMPYIGGGSLAERAAYYTRQKRLMPSEEALTFLIQMAGAIDYAHKQHILHRDIKPDNMLLRDDNWLLLADFGIARMVSSDQQHTTGGRGFGTPEFMAPEQARGQADVTSDTYSLAVVAYLLLTGRLPFQGETAIATVMQHVMEPPPSPRQLNPFLSPACEQILLQGLAKDPAQRPALAQEFVTQLAHAIHDMGYQATALKTIHELPELAFKDSLPALPEPNVAKKTPLSRRRVLVGSALAATALVGLGAGAWGVSRDLSAANSMQLPAQPMVSARPSSSGANKPMLVLTGHSRPAIALLWSRDSSFLISAGSDNQVLRWDITRLLQQPSRPALTPLYTDQLRCYPANVSPLLAWSPDQSRLVVGNQNQGDNSVDAVICTPDLKIQSRFTLQYQLISNNDNSFGPTFTGISWPFPRYIVYSSNEQMSVQDASPVDRLYVIDVEHLQQRWPVVTMQDITGVDTVISSNSNNALALPPVANNDLVAVIRNKSIVVGQIDITTNPPSWRQRTKIGMIPIKPDNIDHLDNGLWSANGIYLVAYGINPGDLFYVPWQQGKPIYKLTVPNAADGSGPDSITSIATNPASLSPGLAAGMLDGSIYLWTTGSGAQSVHKLDTNGITQAAQNMSWSPDGRWLAASFSDQHTSILVWKLA